LVPSTGFTTKPTPLHVTLLIALITGFGSTVITTVKPLPVQLPNTGTTGYCTVNGTLDVLDNGPPYIVADGLLLATPPVTNPFACTGAPHVYVVLSGTNPSVPFTGDMLNDVPVHIVRLIVLIAGAGFTYTVTLN
jgi:hypothetical protein